MRITNVGLMILTAALAWILGACATVPGGPTVGLPPAAPQVVERLEARRLSVRSFSMRGEIVGEGRQGLLSGEHRILGRFPDRLRAEVMGPFDRPVLLLVSDGARLTVLAYGENKAYVGSPTRANLARFLGLALTPEEIYALLSGNVPLAAGAEAQVMLSSERGQALLKLNNRAGVDEGILFSLGDYAVHEAWLSQAGAGFGLACRFNALQSTNDGRFPRRIELADNDRRTLTIISDRLEINQPLDEQAFEVSPPLGLAVHALD